MNPAVPCGRSVGRTDPTELTVECDIQSTAHRDIFLQRKPKRCNISQIYLIKHCTCFGQVRNSAKAAKNSKSCGRIRTVVVRLETCRCVLLPAKIPHVVGILCSVIQVAALSAADSLQSGTGSGDNSHVREGAEGPSDHSNARESEDKNEWHYPPTHAKMPHALPNKQLLPFLGDVLSPLCV